MAVPTKRENAYQLAGRWLDSLGWPNNATTRRVLAAWFMSESPRVSGSTTDIWVKGNNPLNITCRTCSNYWVAGGTHRIVIYNSETAGITAFNSLIHSGGPGYSGIVSAFTHSPNDAAAQLHSINASGWVTGNTNSYINKNGNLLVKVYDSLNPPTYVPSDTVSGSVDVPPSGTTGGGGGQFADKYYQLLQKLGISTDPNHTITHDEATKIVQSFGTVFGGGAHPLVSNFEGKTNAQIAGTLQSSGQAIQDANPTNAFFGLAGKAVGIGAILLGGGLALFGAFVMVKDVYNQNGGSIVDPTPIFVRD